MDNKKYTVTLADGTVISDLSMNGNNFVSASPISADIFAGNCCPVVIASEESQEKHEAMDLIHCTQYGQEYWFALRDLSNEELMNIRNRSDIEYIAMCCDVDL